VYQENQEHFMDLTNHPHVDGIFELQVSTNLDRTSTLFLIAATAAGTFNHSRHFEARKDLHSSGKWHHPQSRWGNGTGDQPVRNGEPFATFAVPGRRESRKILIPLSCLLGQCPHPRVCALLADG
jgi:hypothetical protein